MSRASHPRRRRALAAALAGMLAATVLAVVAGTPAQAANTSGEYLAPDGEREFAGSDRYQTALKLAERFADDRGGIGSVSNAFIASGESLVDAVSAAGLAGFLDAPVLLTRPDHLHRGVADFLDDYGIGNIYVLGGPAAVSDGVIDELEALAGVSSVERIGGDTRYDTSAAIASHLAGESWCGTNENSAIVANGADESLFDAVAIGPVANRLELPVLLTAGDELAHAVLSYIDAEDIEHVVIVGGESSVSAGVAQAIRDAGVDTVERIGGDSAAATSVAVAETIGGACADDLSPVSADTVALVNRERLADGISAAPVLADDTDQLGGGLIPILAVGGTLPLSVRDHLAATAEEDSAGNKIHLRILAVGGTAAVSDSVMATAVAAAGSAEALTVTLSASADKADAGLADARGQDTIHLHFSDDISRAENANLRNKLEDILQINGVPADIATDAPGLNAPCAPDTVTVTLERTLKAGDTVSIVAGAVLVGDGGDRRRVQPTSATVPADPVDRQRPSIRIIAIVGYDYVWGLVSDDMALQEAALLAEDLTGADGEPLFEQTSASGTANLFELDARGIDFGTPGSQRTVAMFRFSLQDDAATPNVNEGIVSANDRFRANRGAIVDAAGNESQVTTATAVHAVSKLRVSSVLMSDLNHTAQARALIPSAHALETPPELRFVDPSIPSPSASDNPPNPAMWLQAKADGAAGGAFGNLWTVRADRASSWDGSKDPDVAVFASAEARQIFIRIVNGEPRFSDVRAALEADPVVSSLFNVLVDNQYLNSTDTCKLANPKIQHQLLPATGDEAGADGDDSAAFTGGITKAGFRVNFNGWIENMNADRAARLLAALLDDTLARYQAAVPLQSDNSETDLDDLRAILGEFNSDGVTQGAPLALFVKVSGDGPRNYAEFKVETGHAVALPQPRDIVEIPDGFDKDADGDPVDGDGSADGVQRTDTGGRSVVDGYGDNHSDGTTDNDFNYGSKVRITRSSSVEAPE
ncbi:MAG: cell wall-binding repeat-containing protein [Acidimicrobiaceae bacterium]|nr:cell wall-binding repeat-containing protein [Acidimicrobiaceae bacterium]